jgi:PBP1b-binding outer membrane lipoprotein LpoB
MKKLALLLALALFLLSCEKDYLIPKKDVPNWLKDRIQQDEESLKSQPRSALNVSAWIRYAYDGNYYYEFVNLTSSMGPQIYMQDGTAFTYTDKNFSKFLSEKCCKLYIWKGPSYFEIND